MQLAEAFCAGAHGPSNVGCTTQAVLGRLLQDPPNLGIPFTTDELQMAAASPKDPTKGKMLATLLWPTTKHIVYKMAKSDESLTKYIGACLGGAPKGEFLKLWLQSSLFGQDNTKNWSYAVSGPPHLRALSNFVGTAEALVSEWGATLVTAECDTIVKNLSAALAETTGEKNGKSYINPSEDELAKGFVTEWDR